MATLNDRLNLLKIAATATAIIQPSAKAAIFPRLASAMKLISIALREETGQACIALINRVILSCERSREEVSALPRSRRIAAFRRSRSRF